MTCRTLKFVSNNAWLISCFRRISLIKVPSQCVGTELSLSILVTGALTLVSPVNRSLLDKATTKTAKRQMEAFIMFLYLESIRLSLKIVVMRFWSFYMFYQGHMHTNVGKYFCYSQQLIFKCVEFQIKNWIVNVFKNNYDLRGRRMVSC